MAAVFISYARKDKPFIAHLHKALRARNHDTWVDWEDIPPSAEWIKEIQTAVEATDTFVFVISPDSVASEICRRELVHADGHNKRLIPVLRRDVPISELPPSLAKLNWVFMREGDNFEAGFESLIRAIDTDLDWVQKHTRLLTRAIEWERRAQDKSLLLRGSDLKAAEEWLGLSGQKEPKPTKAQSQYILHSRKAETARQRATLVGVSLALVVALALAALAWYQRNEKEQQRTVAVSRELAATARVQIPNDAELAVLLALEAVTASATAQAIEALREALLKARVRAELNALAKTAFDSDNRLRARAFSGEFTDPKGELKVVDEGEKVMVLVDAKTGARLAELYRHADPISSVAFSPDSRFFMDGEGHVWNTRTYKKLATLRSDVPGFWFSRVVWSPDGSFVVTGSIDKTAQVWTTGTWKRLAAFEEQNGNVDRIAVSADSRLVVTASSDERYGTPLDRTAWVWEARSGKRQAELRGHTREIDDVGFSSDGKLVLTQSMDGTTRAWKVSTGDPIVIWEGNEIKVDARLDRGTIELHAGDLDTTGEGDLTIHNLAFSSDGAFLATVDREGSAKIWYLPSAEQVARFVNFTDNISHAFAFSTDGRSLISRQGKTAKIWDLSSGREVLPVSPSMADEAARFMAKSSSNHREVLSPDGRFVIDLSSDHELLLKEKLTGRVIAQLGGSKDAPATAAFSPDGSRIAVANENSITVRIHRWETLAPLQDLLNLAKRRVTRQLTPQERARYLSQTTRGIGS